MDVEIVCVGPLICIGACAASETGSLHADSENQSVIVSYLLIAYSFERMGDDQCMQTAEQVVECVYSNRTLNSERRTAFPTDDA